MNGLHGILLILTGVIHIVFGLMPAIYGSQWKAFLTSGMLNTVWVDNDKNMAAFWFVIFGPIMIALGVAVYELETQFSVLPMSVGWVLLGLSVLGAIMSPKSGFTLLLIPQSIFYLYSAY